MFFPCRRNSILLSNLTWLRLCAITGGHSQKWRHTHPQLQLSGILALEPGPSAPAMIPSLFRISGSTCTLHLRRYLAAPKHAPEEIRYCKEGAMSVKQSYTPQSQPDSIPNPSSLENPHVSLGEPHPHPMMYVKTIICSFSG